MSQDLRSDIAKARGLGSAHHGVGHWWWQRMTALAMIPLLPWFVYHLLTAMISPDVSAAAQWFSSPVNSLLTVLMLLAMFMHAKLGLQVVIEDYVKCPAKKYTLLIGNFFVCFVLAAVSIMAVFKLHFLYVAVSL